MAEDKDETMADRFFAEQDASKARNAIQDRQMAKVRCPIWFLLSPFSSCCYRGQFSLSRAPSVPTLMRSFAV